MKVTRRTFIGSGVTAFTVGFAAPAFLSEIARAQGLRYVYTGNVHDPEGDATSCPGCGAVVIARDWYELQSYRLTPEGRCASCGAGLPGRFGERAGTWGRKRLPVAI
jgi:pyruvate formate lyase activating enzyme